MNYRKRLQRPVLPKFEPGPPYPEKAAHKVTLQLYGYGLILPRLGSRHAICPMDRCYTDHTPGTCIHENEKGEEPRWEWRCPQHTQGLFREGRQYE